MIGDQLQRILAAGNLEIGEIIVRQITDTLFVVRHWLDAAPAEPARAALRLYTGPSAARDLVRFDREGRYRPLKGAPTLPTGWELQLDSIAAVKLALDFIYPGALASWFAWHEEQVKPVDLRVTLNRQTGMYRVTHKLTSTAAEELAGRFCRSDRACLRTILWTVDGKLPDGNLPVAKFKPHHDQLGQGRPAVPFLCIEACNLFVAEARKTVKKSPS
jgi:4Fe-4S iron-sulfur cluster binding domain/DR2241 stabilising domain